MTTEGWTTFLVHFTMLWRWCQSEMGFLIASVLSDVCVGQCPSLEWLSLARSKSLKRAVIETRNLRELIIDTCPVLEKLLVWSGELTSLKGLSDSKELQYLFLDCPLLTDFEHPKLFVRNSGHSSHFSSSRSSWMSCNEVVMPHSCVNFSDFYTLCDRAYVHLATFPWSDVEGYHECVTSLSWILVHTSKNVKQC